MSPSRHLLPLLLLPVALAAAAPRALAAGCEPDGVQASGAVYRICMPESWNGSLVLYAHGYVDFNSPLAIPEDQLVLPDGTSVPQIINALGFAFATTSYSVNGLAFVEGVDDLLDLRAIFERTHGRPSRTWLVGPSEGGAITALAVEQHPEVFDGGLAACGPIGDFRRQVNYFGDFNVVFDYFFPGVIPGSPIDIPSEVIADYETIYAGRIAAAIASDPGATGQLLAVTRAPIDTADPATVEETVLGLSRYRVFATNDAVAKLGGQPFQNRLRLYTGSEDDRALNLGVARFSADPAALESIRDRYQTSGRLVSPLVTLHTTGDPIIPYWHETLYTLKTLATGSASRRVNIPVARYGHCSFTKGEVVGAFAVLLLKANRQELVGTAAVLTDAAALADFRRLESRYGALP
ncbi:MAG TPA: hypothetical protein VFT43_14740 [Candidatus Polarisedimenticolia bacterium]|nr:hypothetical protein [Candidatus Polarisedimenticolia bacterium]